MILLLPKIYSRIGKSQARDCTLQDVVDTAIRMELEATAYNQSDTARNLGKSRTFITDWIRDQRKLAKAAAAAALCLWASVVQSPAQIKGAALLIPSPAVTAVRTNVQRFLTWDSSEPKFNIYAGSTRASLARLTTISTNSFPITNGMVYGVAAVNLAGIEITLAYWPSNRVGALETQVSVDLQRWQTLTTLETFTNRPARPRQYLRILDVTKGWLPPN